MIRHEVIVMIGLDDVHTSCTCGWSLSGLPETGDIESVARAHIEAPTSHTGVLSHAIGDPYNYQPRCLCGWVGDTISDFNEALTATREHWTRENEIAFHKARENATGVTYREEFNRLKAFYHTPEIRG